MIKLFKGSAYQNEAIKLFESKIDNKLDYNHSLKSFLFESYGWGDSWKTYLEKTGQFIVEECITNSELLLKKWAAENKINFNKNEWQRDIILEQLRQFQPNVLFAHDYKVFNTEFLKKIKNEVLSIKLILGWDGVDYCDLEKYAEFDVVLTCLNRTKKYYLKNNKISEVIKFGFDPTIIDKVNEIQIENYLSFSGSINRKKGYHSKRFSYLSELAKNINHLKLYTSSMPNNINISVAHLINFAHIDMRNFFTDIAGYYRLSRINNGGNFGVDYYKSLKQSSVGINIHVDVADNEAANIRLFEVTGIGSCLLTDYKDNLSDFFDINDDIVTFRSTSELISKSKYLLDNTKEARKIALNGQKKTLKHYNISNVLEPVIEIINKMI